MKYNLIGDNDYLFNPIETILKNRGIEDIERFLNLDESVTNHWNRLKNIDKATSCLLKHIEKNIKIFIQVDGDCDGYTSSAILINYLRRVFPNINIQWRLHDGKEHGVIINTVPEDVNLVIVPDAGSNQLKEHQELREKGIDIIVLDHHECDKESEYAIIVNNQLSPDFPNKNLSGAGICYKFIQALDETLNVNFADDYLDLVAVGNIGDMMDLRELETRYYVKKGLKNIKNSFLKKLILQQEYSMKNTVNINTVAFYIVPLINAAVRAATFDEKHNVMKSFLESDEQVYYKRKNIYESIQTATARQLVNIKNRQNRLRDKSVELIEEKIKEQNLLENKILVIDVTTLLEKTLTGLVANQISQKYKRPVLLIRRKGNSNIYGGSARGYEKGAIKDLKQFLLSTGKFIFCEGHANAHGVEIEVEKIPSLIAIINERLKDYDIEQDIYDVDFVISDKEFNSDIIYTIEEFKDEWGSTVNEPKLVLTDISINKNDVHLIGKNKNTLKIKYNDIEILKFSFDEEKYTEMFNEGETFIINVLGKCGVNEWEGNKIPQIIADDIEVTDVLYF